MCGLYAREAATRAAEQRAVAECAAVRRDRADSLETAKRSHDEAMAQALRRTRRPPPLSFTRQARGS